MVPDMGEMSSLVKLFASIGGARRVLELLEVHPVAHFSAEKKATAGVALAQEWLDVELVEDV